MDWDEARPAPKVHLGEPLATLSVAELEARVVALHQVTNANRTCVATRNGSGGRTLLRKVGEAGPDPFAGFFYCQAILEGGTT